MVIYEFMLVSVPSSIADIEPSQEGDSLIDENNFLVMTPKERNHKIVGMSHHFDIAASQRL